MESHFIDVRNGLIRLPNHCRLGPAFMHQEFKTSEIFDYVRALHGDPGYRKYQFAAGMWLEKPWFATVSFFNELLVQVEIAANLYPRDQWAALELDLDVEVQTKQLHEQQLVAALGAPEVSRVPRARNKELPDHQRTLTVPATWKFSWGTVMSSHDFNDSSTSIRVVYSNRREKKFARFKTSSSSATAQPRPDIRRRRR